jgi:hypothetical protein
MFNTSEKYAKAIDTSNQIHDVDDPQQPVLCCQNVQAVLAYQV